jgi:hypothetical protein
VRFAEVPGGAKPVDLDAYGESAQACMNSFADRLLGPNGEHLSIVYDFVETGGHEISIANGAVRANRDLWTRSMDCGTILHETLHLVGLVDEYEETAMGYNTQSSPQNTSIFGDIYDQFQTRTNDTYSSPVPGLDVRPGFTPTDRGAEFPMFNCRVSASSPSIMSNHWEMINSGSETLLRSAHFLMIVYPQCFPVTQVYRECAALAYISAFPFDAQDDCPEIPDVCENDLWLDQTQFNPERMIDVLDFLTRQGAN